MLYATSLPVASSGMGLRLKKLGAVLALGLWTIGLWAAPVNPSPLANSLQAIVVTTTNWATTPGSLICFQREATNQAWRPTGLSFPVVVGKKGLGWGSGLHPQVHLEGPRKREGDGKSPAGVFLLSGAFGYAPPEQMKWVHLPYAQCTADFRCVDDAQSAFYNSLVHTSQVARVSWQSAEEMRRPDDCYRLGVFVDHNTQPRTPGGGSCIFLHLWQSPSTGTSGCTAMAPEKLEQLLRWLRPEATPVLVQMPDAQYRRLQNDWALP